jgi:hypothetical protein
MVCGYVMFVYSCILLKVALLVILLVPVDLPLLCRVLCLWLVRECRYKFNLSWQ